MEVTIFFLPTIMVRRCFTVVEIFVISFNVGYIAGGAVIVINTCIGVFIVFIAVIAVVVVAVAVTIFVFVWAAVSVASIVVVLIIIKKIVVVYGVVVDSYDVLLIAYVYIDRVVRAQSAQV